MDRRDVEWPLLIEHLRIGHETVNALPETLASKLHDGTQHIVISKRREVSGAARLQQCLLVLLRKPRRSEIDQVIHQLETRPEMQCKEPAHGVGRGQILRCPIRTECAVGSGSDAGHVYQPRGIEGTPLPRAPKDHPQTSL